MELKKEKDSWFGQPQKKRYRERPIRVDAYPVIDNDLARDNVENDLPAADLEELS